MSHMRAGHVTVLLTIVGLATAWGAEVGWIEDYVLAEDRQAALDDLVPGSEDHYYYTCLHLQHAGDLDAVDQQLQKWRKQRRHSETRKRIELRQAALRLGLDATNREALTTLTRHLAPDLSRETPHQPGKAAAGRSDLDPAILAWPAIERQGRSRSNLSGFSPAGLVELLRRQADIKLHRSDLARLPRGDMANLIRLVADDLGARDSSGFGSLPVHNLLDESQLVALAKLRPELEQHQRYISARLRCLLPPSGVDIERDRKSYRAWLERVWTYVADLPTAANQTKSRVLYHLLQQDLAAGTVNRDRLITWLQLPRNDHWVHPNKRRQQAKQQRERQVRIDHQALPLPHGDDHGLLRACMLQLLATADADNLQPFDRLLETKALQRLLVEAKVTAGVGNAQDWLARLGDARFAQQLKDRIDLAFEPGNQLVYRPADAVSLKVAVKNIDRLLVRVHEIDTTAYHRLHQRDVPTDIDLGGLVANHSWDLTWDLPPLRRHIAEIPIPQATGRGVWVVELIGNGLSTRSVIRKGDLTATTRVVSQGQVLEVRDETGAVLPKAGIWLQGRQHQADDQGRILLPFSSEPRQVAASLEIDGFARPFRFHLAGEQYGLTMGTHVDVDGLIPGQLTDIIVSPRLNVAGEPVTLKRLLNASLRLVGVDAKGVRHDLTANELTLADDLDLIHQLRVPEGLRRLDVALAGQIRQHTTGRLVDLRATSSHLVAAAADADHIGQLLVEPLAAGTSIRALGRNGEPISGLLLDITLTHRWLTQKLHARLTTDDQGRIYLGPLPGVDQVSAAPRTSPGLHGALSTMPAIQFSTAISDTAVVPMAHGLVGHDLHLPVIGDKKADCSLAALRHDHQVRRLPEHITVTNRQITLRGLAAGDYRLTDYANKQTWTVRITAGTAAGRWLLGERRLLERSRHTPLQITGWQIEDGHLVVQTAGAGASSRVHILPHRFVVPGLGADLAGYDRTPSWQQHGIPLSHYLPHRRVGDEERYILDRRHQQHYPGVMVAKPSLLVHPWAIGNTSFDKVELDADGRFADRHGGGRKRAVGRYGGRKGVSQSGLRTADYGFLANPVQAHHNLRPDDTGIIRVPLAEFGDARAVMVVAVNRHGGSRARITLGADAINIGDRRLAQTLDPAVPHARQPVRQVLDKDQTLIIPDIGHAEYRAYTDLRSIYDALVALQPAAANGLQDLLDWPDLDDKARRQLLHDHASHELHLFIYHKDRAWFDTVIKPLIAAKREPDLIDRWLLGDDLTDTLAPAAWQQLNTLERALVIRRIRERQPALSAWIRDQLDVMPPDPQGDDRRFNTLVSNRGMDAKGGNAVMRKGREEVKNQAIDRLSRSAPPAPAASKPARQRLAEAADMAVPMEEMEREVALGSTAGETLMPDELSLDDEGTIDAFPGPELNQRQLYRAVDPTRIWAESRYHRVRRHRQTAALVGPDRFWADYIASDPAQPFRSVWFAEASSSATEVWLALAVLDLPFRGSEPTVAVDGRRLTATATGASLVFASDLRPTEAVGDTLLVTQAIYDGTEPERQERGRKVLNTPDELVIGRPYGQRVVIGNPTGERLQVELLLQLPAGALPLGSTQATGVISLVLDPYQTQRRDISFYWPASGSFSQHPATVTAEGTVLGRGDPKTWNVLKEPETIDLRSWAVVAARGSIDDVVGWLRNGNLADIDIDRCGWRLRDPAAYKAISDVLAERLHQAPTVLAFALLHGDRAGLADWVRLTRAQRFGPAFVSSWLTLDPVDDQRYEHLEFSPLVNPRVHRISGRPQIENKELHRHYTGLLNILAHKPTLDDEDRLALAHYLLTQDRIAEALTQNQQIDRAKIREAIQYDYLQCWLALAQGAPDRAGVIAERYTDEPSRRWHDLFATVRAQVAEIAGGAGLVIDGENREQAMEEAARQAPALAIEVVDGVIRITSRNLTEVGLRCYPMDVERQFSRNPFPQTGPNTSAVIRPHVDQVVKLDADGATEVPLPAAVRSQNVLVDITGAGLRRTATVLDHQLQVTTIEEYGQLEVRSAATNTPLPRTYVKVYRRGRYGEPEFHKDGYTDLRGRFDYATLSGNPLSGISDFAVLVLHEKHGAVIRHLQPPAR